MWYIWNLNANQGYGQYPNAVTVSAMRLSGIYMTFAGPQVSGGLAGITLLLENASSSGGLAVIPLSGSSELAYVQALLANLLAPLATPPAPTTGTVAGGSLAAQTCYVKQTLVNGLGETLASVEATQAVAANNLLQITSPAMVAGATGYNVYASTTSGSEVLQNTTPIGITTAWTEPTTGLVTGTASPPASNTTGTSVALESTLLTLASQYVDPMSGLKVLPPGSVAAISPGE